ncbi:MAG: carboxynorspermidine decarboxylase [Thermodesulfobacteriota bacterium]
MTEAAMAHALDLAQVPTPCYVVDRAALQRNLDILAEVRDRAGCRILMALKGFSMFSLFPQILAHLDGLATSSLDECLLAWEESDKEIHLYAPAYSDEDFPKLLGMADHLVFNSFSQWQHHRQAVLASGRKVSCAIRINPEHREVKTAIYDPCGPHSRLGVTLAEFRPELLDGIEGLHFHTLCELNADALERTLAAVEKKFAPWLQQMRFVNFGGGHHITRPDYDRDLLVDLVRRFADRYGVEVYLEPGEAIALSTGVLVARVLDIVKNGMDIAILDTSAAAHMPDVLEMPYRPEIVGAGKPGDHPHTYRLGGLTCLAGDVIGDYSFPQPLVIGQKLVFCDMAHYTMVKNNTFNGVRLPSIAVCDCRDGSFEVIRRFGHEDYRGRLS